MKYFYWALYIIFATLMLLPPVLHYWNGNEFTLESSLENWAYIAQIATALALVIGFLSYGYQKRRDRRLTVVEQVTFFRKEIIELNERLVEYIFTVIDNKEQLTTIDEIEEFSFAWLTEHQPEKAREQNLLLLRIQEKKGKLYYKAPFIKMLNALEELSISIVLNGTSRERGLIPIRKVFVTLIEQNVVAMMTTNSYDKSMYPNIKKIYKRWYRLIDRKTSDEVQELFEKELKEGRKRRDAKTRR